MNTLKDIMHPKVFLISPSATAFSAAELMSKKDVSCLVIVEGNKTKGIVTMKDLLSKVMAKKMDSQKVKVCDIMTFPVLTIDASESPTTVSQLMSKKRVKRLPVTEQGKVVGIISQTDLVQHMAEILKEEIAKATKRMSKIEDRIL